MSTEQTVTEAQLSVRNIGGIDDTSVRLPPGVTVLAGENATNRTSLLQAIMAALGSDEISMKADADSAAVEFDIDGDTYTRTFERNGSTIESDGTPYLDDPTLADLFAFLLESNEARRAVLTGEDLRELIMRPVDTEEIRAEIDRLLERRDGIDETLETLDRLKTRRPELEKRRRELEEEIEAKRTELEGTETELEKLDGSVDGTREERSVLEEKLAKLRSKRSELEDVRYELETEREGIEATRARERELTRELEDVPETPDDEIDRIETRIARLREQKRELESEINELQGVIGFNRDMLDDDGGDVFEETDEGEAVTDELLADGTVTCWTCGSEVDREQVENTVSRLRELSQRKLSEIDDIEAELETATDRVEELKRHRDRRRRLERRLSDLAAELEEDESAIERLVERRETLREDIKALEAEIESHEDESRQAVLDVHKEANRLEHELGRLEGELDDVEAEIANVEERLDAERELTERRTELDEEIRERRTRIDRIEKRATEAFNEHMQSVLEVLGYDNLERIWIERLEQEFREGRRTVERTVFELHVVRRTDSGAAYEDTVDHLSESEREVTGLVFALAGYLAHDVNETVPFILLDSLEAIDSARIAAVVEYVESFSEYLVVALLPEDAAALPDEYRRLSDI